MFNIQVLNNISKKGVSLLGPEYRILEEGAPSEEIQGFVLRSAKLNSDDYPNVLAIGRAGSGTNNITVDAATQKGVCVFNAPGANANSVCEVVFAMLAMDLRNLYDAMTYVRTIKDLTGDEIKSAVEKNKKKFAGTELAGRTLGVIGLGQIGIRVANGAIGRDMQAVAYEPNPNPQNMHMLRRSVKVLGSLAEVVQAADVLTVHVPLLPQTKNLINASVLEGFSGTHIVNFARGGIVDEQAVLAMLDNGKLDRYLCDFPNKENLNHDKIACLPHLGASTAEAEENCAVMAVRQVKDYLECGVVCNSVNFPAAGRRPGADVRQRITVITPDKVGMVNMVTEAFKEAGVNIRSFENESNGLIGYNIIDVDPSQAKVTEQMLQLVRQKEDVIKARLLSF
jgi:D-3-phosphoglycerate dehydrogenase